MISSDPARSIAPVGIWAYSGIYNALGVSREAFGAWQDKYGFDSLGVGAQGEIFVPAYPIFSKVAWMYIDPVDLSQAETKALIVECERALENAKDQSTREELEAIRLLAVEAISHSAKVRFGHP